MYCKWVLLFNKCVAKLCLNSCIVISFLMPAFSHARFNILLKCSICIRKTPVFPLRIPSLPGNCFYFLHKLRIICKRFYQKSALIFFNRNHCLPYHIMLYRKIQTIKSLYRFNINSLMLTLLYHYHIFLSTLISHRNFV